LASRWRVAANTEWYVLLNENGNGLGDSFAIGDLALLKRSADDQLN
jgi:hypothetical protein